MTIEETRRQILESDEFVVSELKKVQTFYALKYEIRYNGERENERGEDSVAEHIFAVSVLARYFLPLEDPDGTMDQHKIFDMILVHDLDEVETGDIMGYMKTKEDRAREAPALQKVLNRLPESMQPRAKALADEYEERESREAKFMKALDAVEPNFQLYSEKGKKLTLHLKQRYEQHRMIKDKHVAAFPCIERFSKVIGERMNEEGFFVD